MSGDRITPRRWGPAFLATGAVVITALAAVFWSRQPLPAPQPPIIQAARPTPASTPIPAPAPAPTAPSFDVVRVTPSGSAVLAGRAEPGAEVVVRDGAAAVGRTTADARGEWVIVPAAPLPQGARELTVASAPAGAPAGGAETKADASVLIAVPAPAPATAPSADKPAAIAVLLPNQGAPRVLAAPGAPAKLGLGTVDYDDRGEIRFAGTAAPNAPVRVYVDNAPAGDAQADAQGQWSLTPRDVVSGGVHQLRVDQLSTAGRVQSRVELPFQRTTLPPEALAQGRVVVQPGQSLWRLARTAYGSGVRYTVIYLANREQIRDPRLIYPGQAFSVPAPAL